MKQSINLTSLLSSVRTLAPKLLRFSVIFFVLLLAAVYGFVLMRVQTLSNVQPSDADVSAQVKLSASPHINPSVVQQMQSLQDNSVGVHTLFDQARSNPFQE
ncbi:MAG TPA: hypothetical protein VFT53_06700 [Candidatus Saccharimonadales bacterium]|nr:hypothetical protein [Candidatus Saccharimonadales bacterium]